MTYEELNEGVKTEVHRCYVKAADIDIDSGHRLIRRRKLYDWATWRKKAHVNAGETVIWKRKKKYLEGCRKRHPSTFDNDIIVIAGQPMMRINVRQQQSQRSEASVN